MNTKVRVDESIITLQDGILTVGKHIVPVAEIRNLNKITRTDAKFFYLVIGFALIASALHIYFLTKSIMPRSAFGMIMFDAILAVLVIFGPAHLLANRDLVIHTKTGGIHLTGKSDTLKALSSLLDVARSGQETGAWQISGGKAQPM